MDKENLTPEKIADHLAQLLAKPLPKKKLPAKKKKHAPLTPKKPKVKDTPPPEELTIRLWGTHRINGVPYGPGTLTLPRELANQLLNHDQRAREYDENWQRPKAAIVGGQVGTSGHRVYPVSPAVFDGDMKVPELGQIGKEGGFTSFG